MTTMASQITSLTVVYSIVYSGADQRKHQSSASLAFVRGIHRWPVNSPHKGPVTRKMFPFADVIMVVLVLSVIRCSCYYFLDRILFHHDFHHDSCDYHWDFYGHSLLLNYILDFLYVSSSGSANAQLPGCFRPWTFSLNIGLNIVTFGVLYIMFTFPTKIFYRWIPGFETDCPCSVWWRGLTTCLLYVGPLFRNLV